MKRLRFPRPEMASGFILTMLISLLVCLTGCRDQKPKNKWKIGVSQCSDDDWRRKMNDEIEREILFFPEAMVEIRSADDNSDRQIEDLDYFVKNDFDMIIAAPNEADALTPKIEEIYRKGIPVVLFDRNINGESFTAWQGADNKAIGRDVAEYIRKNELPKGEKRILELYGLESSTPARERHLGFAENLAAYPDMKVVATGYGRWNYEDALRQADSLLRLHPDVNVIYAHNDRMALAGREAARRRGIDAVVIGVDAAPNIGIKAVADSLIDATFVYPTAGGQIVRTSMNILKGEPYERITKLVSHSPVTLSNADLLQMQNESLREETSKMKQLKTEVENYWERHASQTLFLYSALAILLLVGILLFVILRQYWAGRRHQEELKFQNQLLEEEKRKQEYLNEELTKATRSKLMFFTNVSHDLRTPLTLISEPVEQLRGASNLTAEQSSLINIACKNIRILHNLINQILDFRKYENGKLDLHPMVFDLREAIESWADSFRNLARNRDIDFRVSVEEGSLKCSLDRDKIERIIYNLLSNAFKHTPANGRITLTAGCVNDRVRISVEDTGEGIPAEDLPHIFDRFYQVDRIHPNGSGIGLALVKAFVDLHEGEIAVESQSGKGTCFIVTLPIDAIREDAPNSEAHNVTAASADDTANEKKEEVIVTDGLDAEMPAYDESKPLLLFVDDNDDMRQMIKGLLKDEYNVAVASDGKEGLRMAAKYVPDLVISDVMMPVMDGLQFTARLKEEVSTSHVPVLLLTACSLDEQRARGYESGADGYISKPFSAEVLKARCRSLIANRKRILMKTEAEETDVKSAKETKKEENTKASALSAIDNEFYARFLKKVEENMGNPEMNVDQLAGELGLGRSQFYRKIKALTNYSPVELLRRIRLKKARALLTTTERSISEIAYEVGFSTPAYFTKCFRDAYGMTPTELRLSLGQGG